MLNRVEGSLSAHRNSLLAPLFDKKVLLALVLGVNLVPTKVSQQC